MGNNLVKWNIHGGVLEFIEDCHLYVYEGVILPSVTQIIKSRFSDKYSAVDKTVLKRASELGTQLHSAIELYCIEGKESDLPEVRNFKFLQKKYEFEVLANEVPVILFRDEKPICAGRLDLLLRTKEGLTLADIKRTSTLDKEYLGYQLNLYRIAYQQCYQHCYGEITALKGVHLREDVRKFVNIPIKESLVWDLLNEWKEKKDER